MLKIPTPTILTGVGFLLACVDKTGRTRGESRQGRNTEPFLTPVRVKQRGIKPIPCSRRVFSAGGSKQSNHRED